MDDLLDIPTLDVLAVEPWLGGSHAAFLQGWGEHTRHTLDVIGLPDRHWKWRMRAGAWELARKLRERRPPEVLFVSDYLDLPAFLGFLPGPWSEVPALVYMHENQLTYPVSEGAADSRRDTSYGFLNALSCIRAEVVVFNSEFHRDEFAGAADAFLRSLPKPNPAAELRERLRDARVVAPGVRLARFELGAPRPAESPLRILFHHRWEHDKDPRAFLEACLAARERGANLELVLLGERYGGLPRGVQELLERLRSAVAHSGFLADTQQYGAMLGGCDLAVSTARHEFFGIGTVEAMAAGVTPLLPERLSYPELVGPELAEHTLYGSPAQLVERLVRLAGDPAPLRAPDWRASLRSRAGHWSVESTASSLDTLCSELCRMERRCRTLRPTS